MLDLREITQLSRLAWPATFSSIGFALMEVVDTAMLGMVGIEPLSGAALASTVLLLFLAFPVHFLRAIAPMVALASARKTKNQITPLMKLTLITSVLLGMGVTLATLGATLGLEYLGYDQKLLDSAKTYLLWRAPFLGVELIFLGGWSFLDGLGRQRTTMVASLVSNLANLLLNLVLISGLGPIPSMGVAGVALSTDLSVVIGLVIITWDIRRKLPDQPTSQQRSDTLQTLCATPTPSMFVGSCRQLIQLGWPLGVSGLLDVAGGLFLGLLIAKLGTTATAAHGIINRLIAMGLAVSTGIGVATVTLIARSLGRRDNAKANSRAKQALYLQIVFGFLVVSLALWGQDSWGRLFTSDSEVLKATSGLLPQWISILWMEGLIIVLGSILEGSGRTPKLLWASVVFDLGLLVPAAWLLSTHSDLRCFYLVWLLKNVLKILYLIKGWATHPRNANQLAMATADRPSMAIGRPYRRLLQASHGVRLSKFRWNRFLSRGQIDIKPNRYEYRFWAIPVPSG